MVVGKNLLGVGLSLDVSGLANISNNLTVNRSTFTTALGVGTSNITSGQALQVAGAATIGSLNVSSAIIAGGNVSCRALTTNFNAVINTTLAVGKPSITAGLTLDVAGNGKISSNLSVGRNINVNHYLQKLFEGLEEQPGVEFPIETKSRISLSSQL